ncbi:MAG: DUF502 domain-containing protein [Candidatus Omnitrophota bacterium]|nr:DUF502 domain-containing protein [Candidatus Omnitrophota bacterium]
MSMKKIWNHILLNFFNGIVLLLPMAVTAALIGFLVIKVNNIILEPIIRSLEPLIGGELNEYAAKILIFLFVICAIAFIGWGAKILVINRVFSFGEKVLIKVPVMGRVYNAAKQIFSAFMGQGKTVFKQVVLIEYPRKGLYSLGFTTGITKGEIKEMLGSGHINVFVPTTPNPTSGVFLISPKENLRFLKMSVEEGMKMIMSGGSVSPPFEKMLDINS